MAMIRRYCVLCRAQIIDHWCRGLRILSRNHDSEHVHHTRHSHLDQTINGYCISPTQKIQEQPLQMISRPETDKVQSILDARNPHPRSIARCTPSSICGLEEADRLSYVDAIRDNTIRILMIKDEAEEYYIMCVFYCVVFV
eukprot:1125207_1